MCGHGHDQARGCNGLEEPAAAVAVEIGKPGGHKPHQNDPAQDAASLALHLDDGHIAMPVFSSQADMQAWRTDVRPAPVTPQRAAQVACLSIFVSRAPP